MSTTATAAEAPAVEDLLAVAEDVWLALIGDDDLLLPRAVPPGSPFDVAAWSSATTISGGWQGVVTVELDEALARRLTTQMLDLPDDAPSDSDVADAVGELVNMVGGNVKSLMPGPSVLSLPAVAAGRAAFASDTALVCRLDLVWRDAPLRISVHIPVHIPVHVPVHIPQEGPR